MPENAPQRLPPPSSRAELELRRFAQNRIGDEIGEDESRLLALLIRRFDDYSLLGTSYGHRANWIIEQWVRTEVEDLAQALDDGATRADEVFPLSTLLELEVGPFRGFGQSEAIDLSKPVIFVYGPNGTGKSSFCEALEYVMLGFIEEAKSKRIDLGDYVKHVPTGDLAAPCLTATMPDGTDQEVTANAGAYRFCFIEKNRIDAFARMSATTLGAQAHRISSLFGLEDFNQFVDAFTENFDRYLSLVPLKPAELEQREREIANHRETVRRASEVRAELAGRQETLAARSGLGVPFADLPVALYGEPATEDVGRLGTLDAQIEAPSLHRRDELEAADTGQVRTVILGLQSDLAEYTAAGQAISQRAVDVSYSKLFEAVRGLRDVWTDETCPACLTPLDVVTADPFERAAEGLADLAELSGLETSLHTARRSLARRVEEATVQFRAANRVAFQLAQIRPLPATDGLASGLAAGDDAALESLAAVLQQAASADDRLSTIEAARQSALTELDAEDATRLTQRTERDLLRSVATEMAALEAEANQIDRAVTEAQDALQAFEEERKGIQVEIAAEAERISADKRLLACYESLIGALRSYRDMLPIALVEDLSEQALEIYNQINAHDPPFDLLKDLVLPKQAGEDLVIRFDDGRGDYFNALQVLSEGHLRCLGVAILLAKNLEEECGLIVFDDVVNAVDDDHRYGLAAVLMNHEEVAARQIIITTHGQEFVRTLSLQIPKEEIKDRVSQIDFLVPTTTRGVVVDRHPEPTHYLVRSAEHIENRRWRDALGDHRRALEAICGRLWKRLAMKYNAQLSVRMRGLRAPPDLRSVVDSMKSFLRKTVASAEGDIADLLATWMELITERWDELNKATHEEEGQKEFEPVTIGEIQSTLESMEVAVARRWREL